MSNGDERSKSLPQPAGDGLTEPGAIDSKVYASAAADPRLRHAAIMSGWSQKIVGGEQGKLSDVVGALSDRMDDLAAGNTKRLSDTLTAQAATLDTMFTELVRRAGINMGEYPAAAERYLRLAFKAQSNSRATIEAIANLHRPREQIVKHVTVHEGGQAVVAEHIHQHAHGGLHEETKHQPHAAQPTGAGAPLLGQDPEGNGVPISRDAERPLPHARRPKSGRTKG